MRSKLNSTTRKSLIMIHHERASMLARLSHCHQPHTTYSLLTNFYLCQGSTSISSESLLESIKIVLLFCKILIFAKMVINKISKAQKNSKVFFSRIKNLIWHFHSRIAKQRTISCFFRWGAKLNQIQELLETVFFTIWKIQIVFS